MDLLNSEQKTKFIKEATDRLGCYYCWPQESNGYSGKDLDGAKYPKTYDCSGLITSCLYAATGIDRRAAWNAQRLMQNCSLVTDPRPGDLCFYGPSRSLVTHVMMYAGKGKILGSSGGDSRTITPQIAQKVGAKVKTYKSHLYRKDFIAFGRLTTKDE